MSKFARIILCLLIISIKSYIIVGGAYVREIIQTERQQDKCKNRGIGGTNDIYDHGVYSAVNQVL